MLRIDFHVHTKHSRDCLTPLKVLKKICVKKRIFPCITDHNTIKGALQYKRTYGSCIVGEEINTQGGELIGLFLNEEIPAGLSVIETIERIKAQDGLVYVPHPFDFFRKESIRRLNFPHDIVEVFNSRVLVQRFNRFAYQEAWRNGTAMAVGSDAHTAKEVGNAYVIMESFSGKKDLLKNLKKSDFRGIKSHVYNHAFTAFAKASKKFF